MIHKIHKSSKVIMSDEHTLFDGVAGSYTRNEDVALVTLNLSPPDSILRDIRAMMGFRLRSFQIIMKLAHEKRNLILKVESDTRTSRFDRSAFRLLISSLGLRKSLHEENGILAVDLLIVCRQVWEIFDPQEWQDLFDVCADERQLALDLVSWSSVSSSEIDQICNSANVKRVFFIIYEGDLRKFGDREPGLLEKYRSMFTVRKPQRWIFDTSRRHSDRLMAFIRDLFGGTSEGSNVELVTLHLLSFPKESFWVNMESSLLKNKAVRGIEVDILVDDDCSAIGIRKFQERMHQTLEFLSTPHFIKAMRSNYSLQSFDVECNGELLQLPHTHPIENVLCLNCEGRSPEKDLLRLMADLSIRSTESVLFEASQEWPDAVFIDLINHCVQSGLLSARGSA